MNSNTSYFRLDPLQTIYMTATASGQDLSVLRPDLLSWL